MKYKHIAILAITLSLIVVTLVSTVTATTVYTPYLGAKHSGKAFTFTIYTQLIKPFFDGTTVDPASIVITYYDSKGNLVTIIPSAEAVIPGTDQITINLLWKDVSNHGTTPVAYGNVGTEGDTFVATGPGWGLGAHR